MGWTSGFHTIDDLPRAHCDETDFSFYIQNFKTLAGFCGCAGQFGSSLVANPLDRFSRDEAHTVCAVHNRSCSIMINIWAASWQNQQSECAPSQDSDQPGHPPSLIRVFVVRMKKAWVLSYPLNTQRRLWSDWADAQADLSLCWAHTHFVGFVMRWLILQVGWATLRVQTDRSEQTLQTLIRLLAIPSASFRVSKSLGFLH